MGRVGRGAVGERVGAHGRRDAAAHHGLMFVECVLAKQKSEIEDGMPGVIWKKTRSSRERECRTDVCHTVSVFVFVFVSPLLKWWTPKAARWARKRSTLCFLLIVND